MGPAASLQREGVLGASSWIAADDSARSSDVEEADTASIRNERAAAAEVDSLG